MDRGLCAEFESVEAVVAAARRLRALGVRRIDAYTPFPIRELDKVLALPRSQIPSLVFAAGVTGAAVAYGIQYWCAAIAYPVNVGGRPLHSAPAFIPITFETTVLFASLAAFLLALAKAGLPRLHHPLFEVEGFERASIDRFWIAVDARDLRLEDGVTSFDALRSTLEGLGASRIGLFGGEP